MQGWRHVTLEFVKCQMWSEFKKKDLAGMDKFRVLLENSTMFKEIYI